MEAFLPIGIFVIVALTFCVAVWVLSSVLGPRNPIKSAVKASPYECGVKSEGGAHVPYRSGFYLIAVLFLLFDVEAAFFFPWALVYRESLKQGPELLIAFGAYLFFMVVALLYVSQKRALELR